MEIMTFLVISAVFVPAIAAFAIRKKDEFPFDSEEVTNVQPLPKQLSLLKECR